MSAAPLARRARLSPALPLTVVPTAGRVRLLAGEDLRLTLEAPGLEAWLPAVLAGLDGERSAGEVVAHLRAAEQQAALELLGRLVAERVLVEVREARAPRRPLRLRLEGASAVRGAIEERLGEQGEGEGVLCVLCQGTLDVGAALAFAAERRDAGEASLWVTTGPATRAYVSPVFLPGEGPCLGCLLGAFRRRSPAPELYAALVDHGARGGAFAEAPLTPRVLAVVAELVLWKLDLLDASRDEAAAFVLHAIEARSLEVSTHPVPVDDDCELCGGAG